MSNGLADVSSWNRWLGTTWKMSPALMYSWQCATIASNWALVRFELGLSVAGPSVAMSIGGRSGPGSESVATIASTRRQAMSYAMRADLPAGTWATTRIVLRM